MPTPEPHDGDLNTHRLCVKPDTGGVFDLQVNTSDLDWFRWVFDAIDGKKTSWLSRRGGRVLDFQGDEVKEVENTLEELR